MLEHDVGANVLRQIRVNGANVMDQWALQDRRLPRQRGLFGIRSTFNNARSKVSSQQFNWYCRVEKSCSLTSPLREYA